ncbi:MAG: oligopeptide/dipeptide ABC transporter ATP-binding protein, partial [Pseudomonadota bacterium]
ARCDRAVERCRDVPPPVAPGEGAGHTALCHVPLDAPFAAPMAEHRHGGVSGTDQAADALLTVRGVTRVYGGRGFLRRRPALKALRGVDLHVRPGETVGIVGESGCGKSTLARILIGLDRADDGAVSVDGRDIATYAPTALARLVQPVFQDPYGSLNPSATVRAILDLPLRLHGAGDAAARAVRIEELAASVGLAPRTLDASPRALSGGQRQRVAIARALAVSPKLLVCDEPTSALDVSVQAQILNLLVDLRERTGIAIVFISHDLAVVEHMCDRIMVMYAGRIVEEGPARAVLASPRHPYTQALREAVFAVDDPQGLPDLALGASPPPLGDVPGCALAPRCPGVGERCRTETPPLAGEGPGDAHRFACHHPLPAG